MAYVEIHPIKSNLKASLEYIANPKKTNNREYVDFYECGYNIERAIGAFKRTARKNVSKKGNNIAWHIIQSFSPEDSKNLTPQIVKEIGKKTMQEMYPDYEYVIAVHTDKEHIHNHIILNAVDFVTYHKLNSNKGSLVKLQNISNKICEEYNLSVISRDSKSHTKRLKKNLEEAISEANTYADFINAMQNKGYLIKAGKYLSFKDNQMEKYIRAKSISLDYEISSIKRRIETKGEQKFGNRKIYDGKIKHLTNRRKLKAEIDSSIKKTNTFEEFIADMQRKNFEVKQGKYLAFRRNNDDEKWDNFIRCKSVDKENPYQYTEEVIRYRITNKEDYKKVMDGKLKKVITVTDEMNGALTNWAAGENLNIKIACQNYIEDNILNNKGKQHSVLLGFGLFLEKYEQKLAEREQKNAEIEKLDDTIKNAEKMIKAVKNYWEYKANVDVYKKIPQDELTADDMKRYQSQTALLTRNSNIISELTEQGYSTKISELNALIADCKEQKSVKVEEMIKFNLELENWEIIKYNYNHKDGENISDEKAKEHLAIYRHNEDVKRQNEEFKQEVKNYIKSSIKSFFGRD